MKLGLAKLETITARGQDVYSPLTNNILSFSFISRFQSKCNLIVESPILSSGTNSMQASQAALVAKNLPAGAGDIRDVTLGWEAPLEEGMATHSSILAWRIPWTEEPDRLQSTGPQTVRRNAAI